MQIICMHIFFDKQVTKGIYNKQVTKSSSPDIFTSYLQLAQTISHEIICM